MIFTPRNPTVSIAPKKDTPSSIQKNTTVRPNVPPKDVVCFKCNGRGHYKNVCLNARAFTMREWEELEKTPNLR